VPRRARGPMPEFVYHVLNRGVRRAVLFEASSDYVAFEKTLLQATQRVDVRLLAYCAMPNHWHLVLWPRSPGQLPRFMHWLTCTHAQRWHANRRTSGTGAVYQGRYKAIPVKSDEHLLRVCRYVERNALRAGLVDRAQDWRWSSLWRRGNFCEAGMLHEWPIVPPSDWAELVNQPQTEGELTALRWSVQRSAPFGDAAWRDQTARALNLIPQFRRSGRPARRDVTGT
jgi:putative transposase